VGSSVTELRQQPSVSRQLVVVHSPVAGFYLAAPRPATLLVCFSVAAPAVAPQVVAASVVAAASAQVPVVGSSALQLVADLPQAVVQILAVVSSALQLVAELPRAVLISAPILAAGSSPIQPLQDFWAAQPPQDAVVLAASRSIGSSPLGLSPRGNFWKSRAT